MGGWFTTLGGHPRDNLGRLNNTEPATQSLSYDGSTITWLRGGTSPEVWHTTFEHSPDGADWRTLAAGARIPGGWQLTGVSLPAGGTLRARGYVTGGEGNASGWFVETLWAPHSNAAPVLTEVADQALDELTVLSLTLEATDADLPANALTFELVSGPKGMAVTSEGSLGWTPTETQGPTTNTVIVKVTDDGDPALSATNAFEVVVREVNAPPVLAAVPDQTLDELTALTLALEATDMDLPTNGLAFSLVSGPAGLVVAPEGTLSWTPSETQGPSTNTVTVKVTDDGELALSATNGFEIVVNEVNTSPVLQLVEDQRVQEGQLLSFTATATDADWPVQALVYSLGDEAPTEATIDAATGLFQWTPPTGSGPATVQVAVVVSDDGNPSLSDSQSLEILVLEPLQNEIVLTVQVAAKAISVSLNSKAGWRYQFESTESLTDANWTTVTTEVGTGEVLRLADDLSEPHNHRFYRVRVE